MFLQRSGHRSLRAERPHLDAVLLHQGGFYLDSLPPGLLLMVPMVWAGLKAGLNEPLKIHKVSVGFDLRLLSVDCSKQIQEGTRSPPPNKNAGETLCCSQC